jgi:CpXC protein
VSIFHPATMTCPSCGAQTEVLRSASVNADLRPDLRDAILDGGFQAESCAKCGESLRLPLHLTLLDLGRGQWIMAEPAELLEQWPEVEANAEGTYEQTFGDHAPPAGRDIGKNLRARLVFGWSALREKLIARDLDLDDVTLELLKVAIMRSVDAPPMADQTELRLTGGDRLLLNFAWIVADTESVLTRLTVPRVLHDQIAADTAAWAPLRAHFDGKLLVDLRRMTTGP